MMKNNRVKKVFAVICGIIFAIFIAACVMAVVFVICSKKSGDGSVNIFGKQIRIVASSSMESCEDTDVSDYRIMSLPLRSAVIIELVPDSEEEALEWYSGLEVGDVLTISYVYGGAVTLSHRIISIDPNLDGGFTIRLQGDNHSDGTGALIQTINTNDTDGFNKVIGKVTASSEIAGKIMYGLKQPVCMILIVIVPSAIIIVFQIIEIIKLSRIRKQEKSKNLPPES